jgi:large subunit ribosomal protein L10e
MKPLLLDPLPVKNLGDSEKKCHKRLPLTPCQQVFKNQPLQHSGPTVKASNFRVKKNMSYARREYMGGIPGSKIVKFTMGNPTREFTHTVELISLKAGQIRHNALEAARIAANRVMEPLGRENFFLKIVPFPHQVLREHKRINVAQADRFQEGMKKAYGKPAQADRFQEGMKKAYGKPVGTAARMRRGKPILIAKVDEADIDSAKEALKRASDKFPVPCRIFVKQNN